MKKKIISVFLAIVMLISASCMGIGITASAVTGDEIVAYARQFLGKPYVANAAGPNAFDCSGLTQYVFKHFGINLPRRTQDMWNNPSAFGTVVGQGSTANACAGDLILWYGHVAIYTSNGGCIEALNPSYGVTEKIKVDGHTNGLNYKVIRVYGVDNATSAPTDCSILANYTSIGIGDSVTFNYNIKGAASRSIGIDRNNQRYATFSVNNDSGSASYVFKEPGTYCCIIEGSNSKGYSCSHGVYVTVVNTIPKDCKITANKTSIIVGDTVNFTYNIVGATVKGLGIDKDNKRYSSVGVPSDNGTTSYKFKEPGVYCCIIEGYNNIGFNCSSGVYITVKSKDTHTHSYSSSVTTQPTCTEQGVKTFSCSCGHSYTESIAALGHDPTKTAAKSATCTEKGYTEGSKCSRCGTVLTAAEEIAPLGHTPVETAAKSATCTEKGYTAGSKCSRCGAVITAQNEIAPLGHDWPEQFDIDKKPTVDENGQKSRKCKRCGAVDTQSIDKLEVAEAGETAQINISGGEFTYDDNTDKYFLTYTIKLVRNPGLSQVRLNVVYDMNTYTMYFDNAGIFDSAGAYTDVQNGEENAFDVVMIYNDDNENITSTGDILTITFYTDNGYFYSGDINFSVEADCTDYNSIYTGSIFNAVDVATLNSAVVIPVACVAPKKEDKINYGDINGDGEIDGLDSTLLMQYLAEWEVEIDEKAADVNNDGEIDGIDSTLLMQYLAEWDVTLG